MKTVAILPLRKGSKGIPGKNLMEIAGKPLFRWVLDELIVGRHVDQILISTDYEPQELPLDWSTLAISSDPGPCVRTGPSGMAFHISRPPELCKDDTPLEPVIEHALKYTDAGLILLANATAPLTRAEDFDALIELAKKEGAAFCGVKTSPFQMEVEDDMSAYPSHADHPVGWDYQQAWPNRQCYWWLYQMVGCGWAILRETFARTRSRIGNGMSYCHVMPAWAVHEVDEPEDVPLIEGLLEMRKAGRI